MQLTKAKSSDEPDHEDLGGPGGLDVSQEELGRTSRANVEEPGGNRTRQGKGRATGSCSRDELGGSQVEPGRSQEDPKDPGGAQAIAIWAVGHGSHVTVHRPQWEQSS